MMPCDYKGCFECFMREEVGEQEWVEVVRGEVVVGSKMQPRDEFQRRSMWLNRDSNTRRYFDAKGEAPKGWNPCAT